MAGLSHFLIIILVLIAAAAIVIAAASIHRVVYKRQYQKPNLAIPDEQAAYLREVRGRNLEEFINDRHAR
jgi:hypothetical protein